MALAQEKSPEATKLPTRRDFLKDSGQAAGAAAAFLLVGKSRLEAAPHFASASRDYAVLAADQIPEKIAENWMRENEGKGIAVIVRKGKNLESVSITQVMDLVEGTIRKEGFRGALNFLFRPLDGDGSSFTFYAAPRVTRRSGVNDAHEKAKSTVAAFRGENPNSDLVATL